VTHALAAPQRMAFATNVSAAPTMMIVGLSAALDPDFLDEMEWTELFESRRPAFLRLEKSLKQRIAAGEARPFRDRG
jgi:hypothetical protein